MKKNLVPALILVGATLAGAGIAAVAAPPPGPPDAPAGAMAGPGGHGPGDHHFMWRHRWDPTAHLDGRLAYLKAELKIKPAQESAWSAFDAAMRKSAETLKASRPKMERGERTGPPPVPARFDLAEQRLTARLDAIKTIAGPAKKLYETLDDAQKKTADEIMSPGRMR